VQVPRHDHPDLVPLEVPLRAPNASETVEQRLSDASVTLEVPLCAPNAARGSEPASLARSPGAHGCRAQCATPASRVPPVLQVAAYRSVGV
jgi:hypothetical protein